MILYVRLRKIKILLDFQISIDTKLFQLHIHNFFFKFKQIRQNRKSLEKEQIINSNKMLYVIQFQPDNLDNRQLIKNKI